MDGQKVFEVGREGEEWNVTVVNGPFRQALAGDDGETVVFNYVKELEGFLAEVDKCTPWNNAEVPVTTWSTDR